MHLQSYSGVLLNNGVLDVIEHATSDDRTKSLDFSFSLTYPVRVASTARRRAIELRDLSGSSMGSGLVTQRRARDAQ
jgi:hypothetical protein